MLATGRSRFVLLSVLVGSWLLLYFSRISDHFSNIDDFGYAGQVRDFSHALRSGPIGLAQAWQSHPTTSPLLPMLATPLTLLTHSPHGLVAIQLPILLGLVAGLIALGGALGFSPRRSWITGVAIGIAPVVTGYAVMLNFALVACTALVWCLVAYLRSEQLRSRRWSICLGVALGLLSLTRVVALVYLAAVIGLMALDMFTDKSQRKPRVVNASIALGLGAVIGGSWWVICGRGALNYLVTFGYDSGSGFAPAGGVLAKIDGRITSTLVTAGLVEVALIAVLLMLWLRRGRTRPTLLVAGTGALVLVGLASSSNPGTAFELPALVLLAVVAASAVQSRRAGLVVMSVVIATLAGQYGALGNPAIGGRPLWVQSYPGREQALAALGLRTSLQPFQSLNASVARELIGRRTLLIRDDALLNATSLTFGAQAEALTLTSPPFGATHLQPADLPNVDAVIAGSTRVPYHGGFRPRQVEAVLIGSGFHIRNTYRLSPDNTVVLWVR